MRIPVASLFLGALAVILAGCVTPASRIAANPAAFARLTSYEQRLVREGQVALGFSEEAVRLALGDPTRVSLRTDADGEVAIWHYLSYEAGGRVLFTGHFHVTHRHWGWGASYPFYLDYPERRVRDRFSLEFHEGVVTAITRDRRD